jgi:hypothetical protein
MRISPGRIRNSVRPSSSTTVKVRTLGSPWRRTKDSEAAMRLPCRSSSASGTRRRCDHSCKDEPCSVSGASGGGSERWIRSPQASMRSDVADSAMCRSRSTWRWNSQPEPKANSSSTATTVR